LGGVANVPINLSDNVLTQEEQEPSEPTPTLANRDLLSEYYGGFDNVPVRKAEAVNKKQSAQKLYRVMYAGKGADASEVYETKEEADAALKKAGGRGAIAGVNVSQKTRGGEMLPVEDVEERKKKYINQLAQTKADKIVYDDQLERVKSPEYKQGILDKRKRANEEKAAIDKAEGAKFAEWKSGVRLRRESENVLNDFNRETGLLKKAYSQAIQSNNPLAALQLSKAIRKRESGIPKEVGARKKFFEEDAVRRRDAYLADLERQAQEEERINRLYSTNPDAMDFM
jgi:hypothetical protein